MGVHWIRMGVIVINNWRSNQQKIPGLFDEHRDTFSLNKLEICMKWNDALWSKVFVVCERVCLLSFFIYFFRIRVRSFFI